MVPLVAGALIGGASSLAGAGLSALSQGRMNKKSMKFQREMFDKTNAYNHPRAQMARLQAAGLNPNLVYGGSAGGTAGTASQPAQPSLKAVDYTTAGEQISQTAQNYFSWKQMQTGIELNEERKENIKQDTINKSIDSVNKAIKGAQGALDYKTKARLFNTTIATANERLKNLSVNTAYIGNKDAREQMITNQTVLKLGQEVRNLKTQGKILNEEAAIKKIDAFLYKQYGLKPHDPYYMRIISNVLEQLKTANLNPFKR